MLEKLTLHNFKSHKHTEFCFDGSRLYAIVGQNSSGKTSVLQGLYYLSMLTKLPFRKIFQHEISPQIITTIGELKMSVAVSGFWESSIRKNPWEAIYSWEHKTTNLGTLDTMVISCKINEKSLTISGNNASLLGQIEAEPIYKSLRYAIYLKLVASNLAKAAYSDEIAPSIEFNGSGLAPTLDYLRNENPDKFELLEERLIRVVPNVRKIGIRRAKVPVIRQRLIEVDGKSISYDESQEMAGQEVILDMNTGERIPGHAISEGTMLTLGLLTVLMYPEQPNLVLLDDIEQGLHPKAQRELMKVFKEIIQDNPNLQIIFTTHSPYILDDLEPSQVHILHNNSSGFTVAKRLDEHPDIEWAKQTLTTGEFWDAEGEEWVIGDSND